MNNLLKNRAEKWLEFVARRPKKFYLYAMLFLSASFVGVMAWEINFPAEPVFKINPPALYTKSGNLKIHLEEREKEMQKIVAELKDLRIKRDKKSLTKNDSLRIEYLYNQYQKLKNGL